MTSPSAIPHFSSPASPTTSLSTSQSGGTSTLIHLYPRLFVTSPSASHFCGSKPVHSINKRAAANQRSGSLFCSSDLFAACQTVHLITRHQEAANAVHVAGRCLELARLSIDRLNRTQPAICV